MRKGTSSKKKLSEERYKDLEAEIKADCLRKKEETILTGQVGLAGSAE